MDPNTTDSPSKPSGVLNPFLQVLLATALAVILFAGGYSAGRGSSAAQPIEIIVPDRMSIEHSGIPSETVECLEWASRNFDKATAGMLSLVCHGR